MSKQSITIISILVLLFLGYIMVTQEQLSTISQQAEETEETSYTKKLPTVETLSTGNYTVGTDIAPGIYNLKTISGTGIISGDLQEGFLNEMMGIMEGYEEYYSETYKNLYLKSGDTFEISGGVTIEFVPIT